jgi:hypothetical protein
MAKRTNSQREPLHPHHPHRPRKLQSLGKSMDETTRGLSFEMSSEEPTSESHQQSDFPPCSADDSRVFGWLLDDGVEIQSLLRATMGKSRNFNEQVWDWELRLEDSVRKRLGRHEVGLLKAHTRVYQRRPTPQEFKTEKDADSWHHIDAYIDWLRRLLSDAESANSPI